MRLIVGFLFVVFLFAPAEFAQNNSWLERLERIKPFYTDQSQVESILGKPKNHYSNVAEFETKDGTVSVFYSKGTCDGTNPNQFDLPKDVVISFDFHPSRKTKFTKLGLDLTRFIKEPSPDVVGTTGYSDLERGVYFSVTSDIVKFVQFSGPKNVTVPTCFGSKTQP